MYFIAPKTYLQSNNQLAYNLNLKAYHLYIIKKNEKEQNKKFTKYNDQYFQTSYNRIYKPTISLVPN
jgi:hypothetical protein